MWQISKSFGELWGISEKALGMNLKGKGFINGKEYVNI